MLILKFKYKAQKFHPPGTARLRDIDESRDGGIAEYALSDVDEIELNTLENDEFRKKLFDILRRIRDQVERPDLIDIDDAKVLLEECDQKYAGKWFYQILLPESFFVRFDARLSRQKS
jgi:hypothetical protein